MNEYLKYNINTYLRNNKTYSFLLGTIEIFFIIAVLICFLVEIDDPWNVNGSTICNENECDIYFYNPSLDTSLNYDYIKINKKEIKIEEIDFGEVMLDNANNAYQKITLKLKEWKGHNNEIVKLQIFKNKEKIYKKIIKWIVER